MTNQNNKDGLLPYHSLDDYYKDYSKTLQIAMKVICFIIPIFVAIFIGYMVAKAATPTIEGAAIWLGVVVALISYGIIAFVSWLVVSYFSKMFDIISNMAHNIEYIAWISGDDEDDEN